MEVLPQNTAQRPVAPLCETTGRIEMFSGTEIDASLRVCIKDTTKECFVPALHDYLSTGWDSVLDDPSSTIVLIRESERCVAIAAALVKSEQGRLQGTPYYSEKTAYLVLGMVPPDRRNQGLYRDVSIARMKAVLAPGVDFVFVRTQSPAVINCVVQVLGDMVSCGVLQSFALEHHFIEKGTYGLQVTAEMPAQETSTLDVLSGVSVKDGDVALCVWRVVY